MQRIGVFWLGVLASVLVVSDYYKPTGWRLCSILVRKDETIGVSYPPPTRCLWGNFKRHAS
jgi:hypothetical protein